MKFSSYRNCLQAATGLIQSGWALHRLNLDENEVTTIQLYHVNLELNYILEHHKKEETFKASTLTAFTRTKQYSPHHYLREDKFQELGLPLINEL